MSNRELISRIHKELKIQRVKNEEKKTQLRSSSSLAIREMKIKTPLRSELTPSEWQ